MSMRALTIAGFVLLGIAALVVYLAGRRAWWGVAPLGQLVDVVRTTLPGRVALFLVWAWLGWHLLAR